MTNEGWISLYRKFLEWEWYDYPTVKIIFLHCLLSANHKNIKWRDIVIKRGQLVTSYEKLATLNGLTVQQVRTALEKLQSTHEITYQSTNQYSIITVKNYNLYQDSNKAKTEASNNQIRGQNNKRITTNNNDNKYNTKEYIYNTHTIEKNVCVENKNLSSEDLKILRKYAKENGARRIKPYVAELIKNGGYLDILKEEKERLKKLERQKTKDVIPPPENFEKSTPEEDEAGLELLRETARQIRKRG